MEQRVSLITLGVSDLGRAQEFYRQLGWQGQLAEETVFFQTGGSALVLWGRDKLARDCGLPDEVAGFEPRGFSGVVLAHNARSTAAVDQIMTSAERAGATITRPAGSTFYGGYAGIFADPEGHYWEIAYNPGLPLAADGSITIPDFHAPPEPDGAASVAGGGG